jgi:hypothetical protein
VRLDPTRALTQRLREQLAGNGQRFALAYAGAPPMRILRATPVVRDQPPVVRPRGAWDREPVADAAEDPQVVLDAKVRRALDGGAAALSAVTTEVTAELPGPERFVEAGRWPRQSPSSRVMSDRAPWVAAATSVGSGASRGAETAMTGARYGSCRTSCSTRASGARPRAAARRHVDRDDFAGTLLTDAQGTWAFYRRYGELIHKADGYFYLLPSGEKLSRRQLGAGDMLVSLALLCSIRRRSSGAAGHVGTDAQLASCSAATR